MSPFTSFTPASVNSPSIVTSNHQMGALASVEVADSELLALFQRGDERAAAELVHRHTAPLARLVRGVSGALSAAPIYMLRI